MGVTRISFWRMRMSCMGVEGRFLRSFFRVVCKGSLGFVLAMVGFLWGFMGDGLEFENYGGCSFCF